MGFKSSVGRAPRSYLVLCVLNRILPDEFELDELEKLLGVGDAIKDGAQVRQGFLVGDGSEGAEAVALAGGVALALEECRDQVGSIGDQSRRMLEDGRHGVDGILSHVCMAMLEAGACRGEEGLDKLRFPQLAEEAQGVASDVFVGMLQVISDTVAERRCGSVPVRIVQASHGCEPPYQTKIISCLSFP